MEWILLFNPMVKDNDFSEKYIFFTLGMSNTKNENILDLSQSI